MHFKTNWHNVISINNITVLFQTVQFSHTYPVSMSKTVLLQTIQFSISSEFSSISPIDRAWSGATTLGHRGPGRTQSKPSVTRFLGHQSKMKYCAATVDCGKCLVDDSCLKHNISCAKVKIVTDTNMVYIGANEKPWKHWFYSHKIDFKGMGYVNTTTLSRNKTRRISIYSYKNANLSF